MGGAGTPTSAAAAGRVATFLRALGHPDAAATHPGAGGEAEVCGREVLAWVWVRPVPVDAAEVQRLAGVATVEGRRAASFARAGYTLEAVRWAFRAGVALFGLGADLDVVPAGLPAETSSARPEPDGEDEASIRGSAVAGDADAMTRLGRVLLDRGRLTEGTLWYRRA
ncbi:MAG TPA: hypothetical protein VMT69_01760, partial [Kineosporiaceae bacterium]|nr:hypothetical protein [Kineosporiaceae bacterium]